MISLKQRKYFNTVPIIHEPKDIKIECPFCHTNHIKSFQPMNFSGYAQAITYCRCESCQLLFQARSLTSDQLGQFYDQNYYIFHRSIPDEINRALSIYNRTIRQLEQLNWADDINLSHPRRVLEIGCARGFMLALLQRLDWETYGVELSASAAQWAHTHLGLNVFQGTIEEYAQKCSAQYDVVMAIDVLEHVPDPKAFMTAAVTCLKPGGILIVDTPNGGAANISISGSRWPGFNPFHIHLFSRSHMEILARQSQTQLLRCASYNNASAKYNKCSSNWKQLPLLRPFKWAAHSLRRSFHQMQVRYYNPQSIFSQALVRLKSYSNQEWLTDMDEPRAAQCVGDNLIAFLRR